MPDLALWSVIAIVAMALVFDYTNGFHDAANSIATVVSTRVLTPKMAVMWAASFNFLAFLVFHTKVANTVGKTVDPAVVSEAVIFAGLVGAIAWNFFTWWLGAAHLLFPRSDRRVRSWCRRRRSASTMAATTPKRPWASSVPCWSGPATWSWRPTGICPCRTGW
jgi:hypothetical protein